MSNEVNAVETVAENVSVVNEVNKLVSVNGKQALIVFGSAAAGVGGYILLTKVVVPKVKNVITKNKK